MFCIINYYVYFQERTKKSLNPSITQILGDPLPFKQISTPIFIPKNYTYFKKQYNDVINLRGKGSSNGSVRWVWSCFHFFLTG